jgi:hypothetical protein
MALSNSFITSSISPIYTCPTGQQVAITVIFFCNFSGSDAILQSVNLVKDGDAPSNSNKVIHNLLIPAEETFSFDSEKIILESGDAVYAAADTENRLSVTLSLARVA